MTVLYTSSFDTGTAGVLPASWTSVTGGWAAKAAGAVSGPLGFGPAATSDGVIAVNSAAQTADGVLAYKVRFQTNTIPSPIFRCDSAFQNGYLIAINPADKSATLFKRTGGGFASILSRLNVYPSDLVAGDALNVEVSFVGNAIALRLWEEGTSRPNAANASWTDNSILSAGYTGVYQANEAGTNANGLDDYTVSDTNTANPTPDPTPSAPALTTIARNDAALRYSPYTWHDDGASANANTTGSYLTFGFTGTMLGVNVVALTGLSGYPVVRAYIDDMPAIDVQLAGGQASYTFTSALSAGAHRARIVIVGLNEEGGWWSLANAVKITGITLQSGAGVSALPARSKRMIFFGDSITQGVRVKGISPVYPTGMDGTCSVAAAIAEALDAELGQVGYGAQGFTQAGNGGVPAFNSAYSQYSSGRSRLVGGVLAATADYVACMHGTNGGASQADIATAISNMRTIAPTARILMIVPPGGFARAAIAAAVNAARSAGDARVHLIDAGTGYQAGLTSFGAPNEYAPDGLHPYERTNMRLAAKYISEIALAIQPGRFTLVPA